MQARLGKRFALITVAVLGIALGALGQLGTRIPSAQAAGITPADLAGCKYGSAYNIVWDGWRGFLVLRQDASSGNPGFYDGTLTYGSSNYRVRWQLVDPQTSVSGLQGPGYIGVNTTDTHRIVFWVDFNNTSANPYDDQRFDGYVMTWTKTAFAGVTWWTGIPFGFYATFNSCVVG